MDGEKELNENIDNQVLPEDREKALNEVFNDSYVEKQKQKEIEKLQKKKEKLEKKLEKAKAKKNQDFDTEENTKAFETETINPIDSVLDDDIQQNSLDNIEKEEEESSEPDLQKESEQEQPQRELTEDEKFIESIYGTTDFSDDSQEEESEKKELPEREPKKKTKKRKKDKVKDEKPEEINIVKELFSLLIYILCVVGVCWLVLTFVGQRTEVSGDSMNNTLINGDSLWIDKLSYRFKEPERFDIVVFPYEEEKDTYYIKRIIGLPGETVYIDEAGTIYINEKPLEGDKYGKEVIDDSRRGVATEPITLGKDEYFVLGDNRNNSRDSRVADVGNIDRDIIIGKAIFRFSSDFGKIE